MNLPNARFILGFTLLAAVIAGSSGIAQHAQTAEIAEAESAVGYDTPELAFAAARDAFNAEDWDAFVDTVSPARRDEIIGQMAVALAGMAQQPGSDPRLGALVDEYLPRNFDPMDLMMSDNAQAETIRLAKRMGDPEGFFVEAMSLIFNMQYSPAELAPAEDAAESDGDAQDTEPAGEAKQKLDAQITAMDDLVIQDDRAETMVTITTSTGDQKDQWTFEKYEGRWYLSMR